MTGRTPEAAPGHNRPGGWTDVAAAEANRDIQRANDYVLLGTIAWMATFPISLST